MPTTPLRRAAVVVLAGAALATALPAQEYTATTIGGPTFNRPLSGQPPTALSTVGTAVSYHVQAFFTATAGSYNFRSVSVAPPLWDNFLVLYRGSFLPGSPLTNAIVANDDFPTIGVSGFDGIALLAGQQYFLVTTGFSNSSAGTFRNTITGAGPVTFGTISVVPEPGTWALLATGLVGVGVVARRRRTA